MYQNKLKIRPLFGNYSKNDEAIDLGYNRNAKMLSLDSVTIGEIVNAWAKRLISKHK